MKTLKNIFGIKETKKSMSNFLNGLNLTAMLTIKGGGDTEDYWPPEDGGGKK